ncbi:serine/threonine-protein phosphatase 7 long form-like protein [Trifolium medium]|uniref:Serine/threonine-protein phosphatase 7 long form-like protein n=1 Tax=Trifolium medium TaxID=97028 RepID=A0A392LYU4_9FABA|nr:serine/threonine-protein phosphatase 7 long form-like protein [Trifolium medium]
MGEVDCSFGIKECGVRLVSVEELESILQELEMDLEKKKKLKETVEFQSDITQESGSDLEEYDSKTNSDVGERSAGKDFFPIANPYSSFLKVSKIKSKSSGASYSEHRAVRALKEVCFYSGCLKCGSSIAAHLPERVLRQLGFTQTTPRDPAEAAPLVGNRDHVLAHFADYLERCLTVDQRGLAPVNAWDVAPEYMRWYFRMSHPYMTPLPAGDPPRPCEEDETEGPLATTLTTRINMIRRIAQELLNSRELPESSRARRDVQQIWNVRNYAQQYRRRGGGCRHATH